MATFTYSLNSISTRGRTDGFIVNGRDFFVAYTNTGCVRIGMVGGTCFDIPAGHAYFARIEDCTKESHVEEYFDELMGCMG